MSDVAAAVTEQVGRVPTEQVNAEESKANAGAQGAGEAEDPQATANSGEDETEEQRKKSGYQRQKEARMRAEAENRFLRELLAQKPEQTKPEVKAEADPEPDPEKYEKDGKSAREYMKDLANWTARQAVKAEREREAEARKQETQKSEAQKRAEEFGKRIDSAREKFDDYDDVVFSRTVPITTTMREALEEMDLGAEVAYEVAKDGGAEAKRISQLSPFKQAVELGKIEARLAHEQSKAATEAEEKPEPPVSKAPPPPTPVKRPAAANVPDINDPKLSFKQFVKLREEQVAKRTGK